MEIFKFLLLLFTIKINFILIMGNESCDITIREDLPARNSPFLLHSDLKDGFYYPNSDGGTIKIKPGESIVLACPGESIYELSNIQENTDEHISKKHTINKRKVEGKENPEENKKSGETKKPKGGKKPAENQKSRETKKPNEEKKPEQTKITRKRKLEETKTANKISEHDHVLITCKKDAIANLFTVKNTENTEHTVLLKNIRCRNGPKAEIKKTKNKCFNDAGIVCITGFEVSGNFYPIFEFCHDETVGRTIYANSTIVKQAIHFHKDFARRDFAKNQFFGDTDMKNTYEKISQMETIADIVGSMELAKDFIHETGANYLARGHLVAKTDFIFGSQQLATFSYVNAIPMWQCINAGNWLSIENSVRQLATRKNLELNVWTGGFENLQTKDQNKKLRDVYLRQIKDPKKKKDIKSIPVPKFLFKVVYDRANEAGVAIITINDPYLEISDFNKAVYVFCEDICSNLTWLNAGLKENINSSTNGYTFCCNVVDFRNKFKEFPQFQTSKLLL